MRLPTVVVRGDVLESWLTISDYSRSQLAQELRVSKGRISQLLTSHEEPSAHLIAKLMTLTHLPFDRLFKLVRTNSIPQTRSLVVLPTSSPSRPRRNGRRTAIHA